MAEGFDEWKPDEYTHQQTTFGATSVDISWDGAFVAAGRDDYNCVIWKVSQSAGSDMVSATLAGHDNRVSCVAFLPGKPAAGWASKKDEKKKGAVDYLLATGSWDSYVKIWAGWGSQQPNFNNIKILKGHFAKIYALAWLHDTSQSQETSRLVSASQDGKLIVWNAMTAKPIQNIPLQSSWIMTCATSWDGRWVAAGGLDQFVSVYDLQSTENPIKAKELPRAHTAYVSCIAFAPTNDRILASSSGDMSVMLWDFQAGVSLCQIADVAQGDVLSVKFSLHGNRLIFGGSDAIAYVVSVNEDYTEWKPVAALEGHEADINAVAFSPNDHGGGVCVTGSDDASVRVWYEYPE